MMNIIVETKCEGCTDGRVPHPTDEYGASTECARCKGTSLERTSVPFADISKMLGPLLAAHIGEQPQAILNLRREVAALKARLKLVDGFADYVESWQVDTYRSQRMNRPVHSVEAERMQRLERMLKWEDVTG